MVKWGISKAINAQEKIRHGADMRTIYDPKIGTCSACSCYLKLKIWVPISHILDNLDPAQFNNLHPDCWVRKETK